MGYARAFFSLVVAATFGSSCASCGDKTVHSEAIRNHDAGIAYLNQGQCVQAEERCRLALEYGPNFEHAYNCLGMVELQCRGDLDKAAQFFKDALAINSDFAEAHNNLGVTFFRRTPPKYDAACDEYKAAIEIDPAYLDARENYADCLMRKGTILGDRGDTEARTKLYRSARSQLIRLLELDGGRFNARHHLGFMDLTEGRYESAEQNFRQCLAIDPENPVCAYNLGNTYLKTARCSEAIEAYIVALRDKQESDVSIGARTNLAAAYELCAVTDGAIREFLDRIKTDPGNPTHHFDLGNIYADRGLPDRAVNEWENTVKLDPLYCPAYFEIAMHANKMLDTDTTISRCQDFVACTTNVNKDASEPRWTDRIEQCKALIKKLEIR
ncbi:MAG: tetratricopeptide repeat protein [Deltaproteobacteria bacterium]|nr:tetratricopeptide repeat protein [Deltaproteobacteria bacterium]